MATLVAILVRACQTTFSRRVEEPVCTDLMEKAPRRRFGEDFVVPLATTS
jgi:hypothetical protein